MHQSASVQRLRQKLEALNSICKDITAVKQSRAFEFMDLDQFRCLLQSNVSRAAQVYWTEILYRSHVASITALARHSCWIEACLKLSDGNPSFLGFAACLRGLLESSADTFFSLRAVPLTIASNYRLIGDATRGVFSGNGFVAEDLENLLIHFLYARKLEQDEMDPGNHRAEPISQYVKCLVDKEDASVKKLYAQLCQIAHPAAQSVHWMIRGLPDSLQFCQQPDDQPLHRLLEKNVEAVETVADIPVNISICTLKVLNRFCVTEVRTEPADRYTPPGWTKVEAAIDSSYRTSYPVN